MALSTSRHCPLPRAVDETDSAAAPQSKNFFSLFPQAPTRLRRFFGRSNVLVTMTKSGPAILCFFFFFFFGLTLSALKCFNKNDEWYV